MVVFAIFLLYTVLGPNFRLLAGQVGFQIQSFVTDDGILTTSKATVQT